MKSLLKVIVAAIVMLLTSQQGNRCRAAEHEADRDHFKVWEISGWILDEPVKVKVMDQFHGAFVPVDITVLEYFSNPVEKNGSAIIRPDDHLTWFKIDAPPISGRVEYVNQFGYDTVSIHSLDYLLVPTWKAGHEFPADLDHYLCYWITDGDTVYGPVTLEDQFDDTPETIDKLVPAYFCAPCDKIHDADCTFVVDPWTHYVVYFIWPEGEPNADTVMHTFNQISDSFDFVVSHSTMLMVPSSKLNVSLPSLAEYFVIVLLILMILSGIYVIYRRRSRGRDFQSRLGEAE